MMKAERNSIVSTLLGVCATLLLGCTSLEPAEEAPGPASPELERLSHLIGTWVGTAEMVSASGEVLAKDMVGEHTSSWTLGGNFITSRGWHEVGADQRTEFVEYIGWDPSMQRYRTWYVGDTGQHGSGWWSVDADGTVHVEVEGIGGDGLPVTASGTMRFPRAGAMEWDWSGTGAQGKVNLRGTNRLVR